MMGNPAVAVNENERTKPLSHVIEAQQFDRELLAKLFDVTREMENVKRGSPEAEALKGYIMATMFYEPSTRTRLSFESAMSRLGGFVLTTENAKEFSSASKGETLEGGHTLTFKSGPRKVEGGPGGTLVEAPFSRKYWSCCFFVMQGWCAICNFSRWHFHIQILKAFVNLSDSRVVHWLAGSHIAPFCCSDWHFHSEYGLNSILGFLIRYHPHRGGLL